VTSVHAASDALAERVPSTVALQSVGLLSALIFLINSIYEVLVINGLYRSQYVLIALLLGVLSLWAFLEAVLIRSNPSVRPLQALKIVLAVQIGVVALRHPGHFLLHSGGTVGRVMSAARPEFGQAILFLPVYFVLFLAISRCLIDVFAYAERTRANQLQRQMALLRRAEADLQASETRYRNFFNLPLVGTVITSVSQGWLAVNDQTCAILGYGRDELFRKTWSELTHPADRAAEATQFKRLLDGAIEGFQLEKRFIRKDGTILHALVAGGCTSIREGQSDVIHLNIIDISDRKRVESALAAAQARARALEDQQRAQLEQKLKTSLTAAAVVHEIQHPLAAIRLNCSLAEEALRQLPSAVIPDGLRAQLSQLAVDGHQLSTMMERMRMLLRNVETVPTPLDLTNHIHSAIAYLRRDLQRHQVAYTSEGLEGPCPLLGDGAQLQTAVLNLIRNAIQAMEQQPAASRRLLIALRRHPDHVRILVADSGPGFPDDYSGDTSWELLKSTKASGMGIGLFLVQTATTNHTGRLCIGRSAVLGGAEVVMDLPCPQAG
jgi:PAS domain S-box-containing protein